MTSTLSPILVYTNTTGFRHGAAIDAGVRALRDHAVSSMVPVAVVEDPAVFQTPLLDDAAAVVWLNASGDTLSPAQQERLETYLRGGGGFAGVHFATGGEPSWPLFERIVGARFRWHPEKMAQSATVRVEDATHPSTSHLPATWEWVDEWHAFDAAPDAHLLLSVDTTTYDAEGTAMPAPHPVSWCSTLGEGRTWFTSLGHHPGSYDDPLFRAHLWGGIESVRRGA
jgi:type 1 glutamine amidotransferase